MSSKSTDGSDWMTPLARMHSLGKARLSRRGLVQAGGALALTFATIPGATLASSQATPELLDMITVDLSGEPESIDPAIAYAPRDWSIVHSIYDSPVQFGENGEIEPLAAESLAFLDSKTIEIKLRSGITFHDGSPLTSAAITRSVNHLKSSNSKVVDLFSGITEVKEVDELTAHIITAEPSPSLPSQMVAWLLLLPEGATSDSIATNPIGTGPYKFVEYTAGSQITLARNDAYTWGSPKGTPLAEKAIYRFVPEASTRVADLSTGTADIIIEIARDQRSAIEASGATAVDTALVGSAWIRLITDEKPFDDPRVRQAMNHAVDVQSIATALVSPEAKRLAGIYPDKRCMGFDPNLVPYAFDPDKARALLKDAGLADGIDVGFDITTAGRQDVTQAIAAQLADVGIRTKIRALEYTEFNATFKKGTAPLRMLTWSGLFDPQTLLSLMFAKNGYLSRYTNADADKLIAAASVETDSAARLALYKHLGKVMFDDPAAIYLWNMTALYGVSERAKPWHPRGDEYVLPVTTDTANS